MNAIHRILVAVKDPQAKAHPAVEKAVQLARAWGASIELFHAISEPVYADFELSYQSLQDLKSTRTMRDEARLEALATRFRQRNALDRDRALGHGDEAAERVS